MRLVEGQLITAPFLSQAAEVREFEAYYPLAVLLQERPQHPQITPHHADHLTSVQVNKGGELSPIGDAEDSVLFIETNRVRPAISPARCTIGSKEASLNGSS